MTQRRNAARTTLQFDGLEERNAPSHFGALGAVTEALHRHATAHEHAGRAHRLHGAALVAHGRGAGIAPPAPIAVVLSGVRGGLDDGANHDANEVRHNGHDDAANHDANDDRGGRRGRHS